MKDVSVGLHLLLLVSAEVPFKPSRAASQCGKSTETFRTRLCIPTARWYLGLCAIHIHPKLQPHTKLVAGQRGNRNTCVCPKEHRKMLSFPKHRTAVRTKHLVEQIAPEPQFPSLLNEEVGLDELGVSLC